jgi:methyl-accepting chemotaxis protein
LGGGFAAVLCLLATMMAVGLWQFQGLARKTNEVLDVRLTKERLVSEWYAFAMAATQRTKALVLAGDDRLDHFFAQDTKESKAKGDSVAAKLAELPMSREEKQLIEAIMQSRQTYVGARDRAYELRKSGQTTEAIRAFEQEFLPSSVAYVGQMQHFLTYQRTQIDAQRQEIAANASRNQTTIVVLGMLALAAGTLCSVLLTRSITAPLRRAMHVAQDVAKGHLSRPVGKADGRDEIAQLQRSLDAMTHNLGRMVLDIRQSAQSIEMASREVASGNADLSARTEQSASNLEETAASMEQLTGTVGRSTESARQAEQLVQVAAAVAHQGSQAVTHVVATMQEIEQSSKRIGDIIGTIDGIAFQTNILALNAAVEAARAGEQGRGFAVVAGEVRSLAQRSAEAAREIKGLIGHSIDKVDTGSRIVAEAGSKMEDIVSSVQRVSAIVGAIALTAGEQHAGIGQINAAVGHLGHMTQQNAALVEQSAAAAQSLQGHAQRLAQSVDQFHVHAA